MMARRQRGMTANDRFDSGGNSRSACPAYPRAMSAMSTLEYIECGGWGACSGRSPQRSRSASSVRVASAGGRTTILSRSVHGRGFVCSRVAPRPTLLFDGAMETRWQGARGLHGVRASVHVTVCQRVRSEYRSTLGAKGKLFRTCAFVGWAVGACIADSLGEESLG